LYDGSWLLRTPPLAKRASQQLFWVLEQLGLLETFDELRGGLDFARRYPDTEKKRFVRLDVDRGPVERELCLGLVSCAGYFAGLSVATV
jgi:hypothetical protein